MSRIYDALVIGAGQAGLAAGWHLKQRGLDFAILEAAASPGGAWRSYYDSLELFSPAGYSALPGLPFPGDPDRYPRRDEVTAYLQNYASHHALPIIAGARVSHVARQDTFEISTDEQRFAARTLVVASGGFNAPVRPQLPGHERFGGRAIHSSEYRSSQGLEGKRIVVVGAGNSAVQIAYELAETSRVTLAVRRRVRFLPQRLLGRDIHFWLKASGLDRASFISDQSTPVLDDGRYRQALRDGRIEVRPMFVGFEERGIVWSTDDTEPVDAVIFATGFRPNFAFLAGLPALDGGGGVRQRRGVSTTVPGLYFVGLPGQRNLASATLRGVGPDAALVTARLSAYLARGAPS